MMEDSRKSQRVRQAIIDIRRDLLDLLLMLDAPPGDLAFDEAVLFEEDPELGGTHAVHGEVAAPALGTV